jgi:hypothetical protein
MAGGLGAAAPVPGAAAPAPGAAPPGPGAAPPGFGTTTPEGLGPAGASLGAMPAVVVARLPGSIYVFRRRPMDLWRVDVVGTWRA